MANKCPNKKTRVSSNSIKIDSTPEQPPTTNPSTVSSSAQVAQTQDQQEHMVVETKVNGHSAKTLIDNQTIGADLISNQFCITYAIPLQQLETPVTINLPLKESRGSSHKKATIDLDYGKYKE